MPSLRRLRDRLSSEEDGSLLVEVLVSAAILLVVSVGVLLALQTSNAQSALQRSKALATDVAQTQLDKLRSDAYNDLRPLNTSETITEGGIDFTVVSTATPVTQTSAPSGCDNSRARDYMNLKTTVTWSQMGAREPVVLQTMLAAPVGVGGGLVVSVTGASGQGISGIPISLTPNSSPATTDGSGCARWDAVNAGSGYTISASASGYVQPNGEQDVSIANVTIAAEDTATKSFAYDLAGGIRMRFRQKTTANTAGVNVDPDAVPDAVTVVGSSYTMTRTLTKLGGTAGTDVGATGTAGSLYPTPAPAAYSVYADDCTAAKPPLANMPSATVPAGGWAPSATTTVDLNLPNLNIKVTNGSTSSTNVYVKTGCGDIIGPRKLLADGTLKNPGMPYGTGFQVCAVDGSKKKSATADNTSYNAPSSSGQTSITLPTSNGTCPFTIP